jgi:hypothetical protein
MHSHLCNARHGQGRVESVLHVIAVAFNPVRFQSRYNLFREFAQRVGADPHVKLWVVELAYGNRPFELTEAGNPQHIQFRTSHELWHKERMINEAVARLPQDWEYCAWIDADVNFINPDWAHETIQQLQHYSVVQMFTHAVDIGPQGEPIEQFEGFAHSHMMGRQLPLFKKPNYYTNAKHYHPGYAWAYRREAWNTMGGLLDVNIVGGGDHQMAYGLLDCIHVTIPKGSTSSYSYFVKAWQNNATKLRQNIGAVPGTLMHYFHGTKKKRGYHDRWKILTHNGFDPVFDLKMDWQQMWTLTENKTGLRDQLRAYFRARNEDSIG